MNNKFLKLICMVCSFSLLACNNNNNNDRLPEENEIKDASGIIHKIPDNPKEATAASVYAVSSPFFLALDMTDRVLAINTKKPFMKNNDQGFKKAGTVGNGIVDLEKLASYNPTALIHKSNDPKTVKAVNKLNIDVITITVENMDDVKFTLNNLGKYFGEEKQAKEVSNWIDNEFKFIDDIVKTIPLENKVTALTMGGELGRVAASDMLQTWMIEKAGGIPVVDVSNNHNWINIGIEKVFKYNPQYIFCTSSTARNYDVEKLFNDSSWSTINAGKNRNIFIIPSENDSWDMPGLAPVLGTMYMLKTMYPEYLSIEEFRNHIDDYYKLMFGKTFTEEQLGYTLK